MQERYEPRSIEPKWQERWEKEGLFKVKGTGPRKYVLEMFPYPSGAMHMGHVRNYLIGDVLSRVYRMRGFDVLHPMGWDALGLPAENAAIKDQRHPAERTVENVAQFKAEMKSVGYAYDWSREINTSDPEYYRWNQWFFLQMRERGLVYRRQSRVNWCPGCATVIANEQVKDGVCERSNDPVVIKRMPEWAFRITKYTERLLQGLDTLTEWPERITKSQREWIGKSEGAEIDFKISPSTSPGVNGETSLRVFTTRADTLFGVTYVVVAPDHPLMEKLVTPETAPRLKAFAAEMEKKAAAQKRDEEPEKEGCFTGAYAIHPFTGAKVPVWAANFVVSDYGTGAVMSVPAHDQRDFEFAKKYALPIRVVIQPRDGEKLGAGETLQAAFTEEGVLQESGEFSGLSSEEARKKIGATLGSKGQGGPAVTYKQRDWGVSRQRYWGTPIPIVYCEKCDPEHEGISVPYDQLPVKLPYIDVAKVLTGRGEPPLAKVPEFINTTCPKCSGPARREPETMDTFVDSTWYFARYLSPHDDQAPFDKEEAKKYLPVDVYVGGPEHANMHLLYFRFWTMVMHEMGLTPTPEPVKRLITQGMVLKDGRKMGKRWGNVVSPKEIVQKLGADTARTFVMFAGPVDKDIDWSDEQVEGCNRLLNRFWRLAYANREWADAPKPAGGETGRALATRKLSHKTLKNVTADIDRTSFNTAISKSTELVNYLTPLPPAADASEKSAMAEAIRLLAVMLSPFAPHISEEISEIYGSTVSLQAQRWPEFDATLAAEDSVSYAVQVNGKLRGQVELPVDASEEQVKAAAAKDEKVAPHLEGKAIKKVIFVPKRLVNFVVAP